MSALPNGADLYWNTWDEIANASSIGALDQADFLLDVASFSEQPDAGLYRYDFKYNRDQVSIPSGQNLIDDVDVTVSMVQGYAAFSIEQSGEIRHVLAKRMTSTSTLEYSGAHVHNTIGVVYRVLGFAGSAAEAKSIFDDRVAYIDIARTEPSGDPWVDDAIVVDLDAGTVQYPIWFSRPIVCESLYADDCLAMSECILDREMGACKADYQRNTGATYIGGVGGGLVACGACLFTGPLAPACCAVTIGIGAGVGYLADELYWEDIYSSCKSDAIGQVQTAWEACIN